MKLRSERAICSDADALVCARTLYAAIPGAIVGLAVAIFFAIGLVVAIVVADKVGKREAVVRGDKIDTRVRAPAI